MASLDFVVYGEPIPQGSMKAFRGKGRYPIVTSDNKRTGPWKRAIAQTATALLLRSLWEDPAFDEGVMVDLEFRFVRPPSAKRTFPSVRPDLDKLVRAVLDALTMAHVWTDDGQVVVLKASKTYCRGQNDAPHVRIHVEDLP